MTLSSRRAHGLSSELQPLWLAAVSATALLFVSRKSRSVCPGHRDFLCRLLAVRMIGMAGVCFSYCCPGVEVAKPPSSCISLTFFLPETLSLK